MINLKNFTPNEGGQTKFLNSPDVTEIYFSGGRGAGRTLAMLMSFANECGKGYGVDWDGVIFRKKYVQLSGLIALGNKWFPITNPGTKFSRANDNFCWFFPDGEKLRLREFGKERDYQNFHGHRYPFVGWDELPDWQDDVCYTNSFSFLPPRNYGLPSMIRATGYCGNELADDYKPNWADERFGLPRGCGVIRTGLVENGFAYSSLVVSGFVAQNKPLLEADPSYQERLTNSGFV